MNNSIIIENSHTQKESCCTNKISFYSRICTICLGSLTAGITIIYYPVMIALYRFDDQQNQQIHKWKYDMIGSIVNFVAFITSFITYKLQHLSRRYILMLGPILGIIGNILSILSFIYPGNYQFFNIPLIAVGRVFEGIMLGIFVTFCLALINEYSPYNLRLNCICIQQIFLQFGTYIVTLIYPILIMNFELQRFIINIIMYCSSISIMLLQVILLIFVFKEQSPIYLIQHQRQQEARSIIQSMYDFEIIDEKFLECKYEADIHEKQFYDEYDIKSILRKSIALGCYAVLINKLSGSNYVITASYKFNVLCFEQVFMNSLPKLCQLLGTITLFVISNIRKMKQFICYSKRKPFIQFGCILSVFFMLMRLIVNIIGLFTNQNSEFILKVIQYPFMFQYRLILAPMIWLYLCQMLKIRQLQMCIGIYWFLAFFIDTPLPFLMKKQGANIIIPTFYLLCSVVFVKLNKWYLIQTKNKSYLQIVRQVDSLKCCPTSK